MSKTSQRAQTKATAAAKATPKPEKDITESFLREVDDVIQQEKLAAFWDSWKVAIVGGVVAVLFAVAGWQGWQSWQRHAMQETAQAWYAAQQSGDANVQTQTQQRLLTEGSDGYRAMAAFALAKQQDDPAAADALYKKIYTDGGQEKWVRDLARLNAAMRLLGRDDAAAEAHLRLLAQYNAGETPEAATALAMEQLAWLAVRRGDLKTAKSYASQLGGLPGVPPDMVQRLGRILSL